MVQERRRVETRTTTEQHWPHVEAYSRRVLTYYILSSCGRTCRAVGDCKMHLAATTTTTSTTAAAAPPPPATNTRSSNNNNNTIIHLNQQRIATTKSERGGGREETLSQELQRDTESEVEFHRGCCCLSPCLVSTITIRSSSLQIPASVISSVGTTTSSYQPLLVVSAPGFAGGRQYRLVANECEGEQVPPEPCAGNVKYVEMVLQQEQSPHRHLGQSKEMATSDGSGSGAGDQYGAGAPSHISMNMGGSSMAATAPRLHPKKRKYDPTESEQFATDLSAQSQQQQQQQQHETGVSYSPGGGVAAELTVSSSSSSGHVAMKTDGVTAASAMDEVMVSTREEGQRSRTVPELDLRDWCETRVLAKYKKGESVYVQGVIKSSDAATELVVEFEGPEGGLRQTYDVINSNRFDIIADASPSISDVSINAHPFSYPFPF